MSDDPQNEDSDRRVRTDRRGPEDGTRNMRDDSIPERVAVLQERVDQHDVEIRESHDARKEFIPRILLMEKAVFELSKEAVPHLTAAVDAMTKELIASRVGRKIVLQLLAWGLAILTTITGAVLSYKAIDVLQQKTAVTNKAPR